MSKPIHILLIDDVEEGTSDYPAIEAFQSKAREFGFKIKHVTRGKTGLEELRLYPNKYKGLILDARCIWDVEGAFPNDRFLGRMLTELERLENELQITLPTVVNTAHMEEFIEDRETLVKRGGEIFFKSSNSGEIQDKIFYFLKARIENSNEWKYKDIFELFDKNLLDDTLKQELLEIIEKLDDKTGVKSNFNPLRKILEAIYEKVKEKDTTLIPDAIYYGRGGGINLDWSWRYLSGLRVNVTDREGRLTVYQTNSLFPQHISKCVKACEELSSIISHRNTDNVSIYAYMSAVFGLMEVLNWFHEFIERP